MVCYEIETNSGEIIELTKTESLIYELLLDLGIPEGQKWKLLFHYVPVIRPKVWGRLAASIEIITDMKRGYEINASDS